MKKPVIIGCSVIGVIVLIILLICGGLTFYGGSKYISGNSEMVKSMIGNETPKGYMPVMALDFAKQGGTSSSQNGKMAMLMGPNGYFVMLVEAPPITSEADKEKIFEQFQQGLRNNQSTSGQEFNLEPAGSETINGIEVPKYNITMVSEGEKLDGTAYFFEFTNKTLFFVCFAKSTVYNESVALDFAKVIKEQ